MKTDDLIVFLKSQSFNGDIRSCLVSRCVSTTGVMLLYDIELYGYVGTDDKSLMSMTLYALPHSDVREIVEKLKGIK